MRKEDHRDIHCHNQSSGLDIHPAALRVNERQKHGQVDKGFAFMSSDPRGGQRGSSRIPSLIRPQADEKVSLINKQMCLNKQVGKLEQTGKTVEREIEHTLAVDIKISGRKPIILEGRKVNSS